MKDIKGGNQYYEKWPEEACREAYDKLVKASENPDNDFIGEACREAGFNLFTAKYIYNKFPHLKSLYSEAKSNCEINCFANTKKGNINTAAGIINLKSNHGWRDRQENVITGGDKPVSVVDYSKLSDEALKEIINASADTKD